MAITPINVNLEQNIPKGYKKDIPYGYIDLRESKEIKQYVPEATKKDKILALTGSAIGVSSVVAGLMRHQKVKNPLKLQIKKVWQMLTMAAAGNIGGILLSSVGEHDADVKKKWKEGAFQMLLTASPMLLVDGSVKMLEKSSSKILNNNAVKLGVSALGVYIGSHLALAVSNKLRNERESKKPKRELKPVDMIANLDDVVAMMVLAKIPFADKIKIERLLPFIYTFCGYRSGTGDRR